MKLDTIYKRTATGKIQHWTIEIHEDKYRTISGQISGKSTTSEWTVCKAKNPGKTNETTGTSQALKEATAKRRLKLEGEYKETQEEVDVALHYIKPMLAKDYNEYKNSLIFPVISDPKLNGMRCGITKDGMFSRNGKPIVSAPHIFERVKHLFKKYPNLYLDGELYNHKLRHTLNQLISLVRRSKPSKEELAESNRIVEFHVYDGYGFDGIVQGVNTILRKEGIRRIIKGIQQVRFVEYNIAENQAELNQFYQEYLSEDYEYEGQMVRKDAPYENKDAEYLVLDITEGEGNRVGTAGRIHCQTADGKKFCSNIKGDFEYITKVLKDKDQYIGKTATVKYFELTEYGIPQFPYVIAFDPIDR
jgi:hypothetical protein